MVRNLGAASQPHPHPVNASRAETLVSGPILHGFRRPVVNFALMYADNRVARPILSRCWPSGGPPAGSRWSIRPGATGPSRPGGRRPPNAHHRTGRATWNRRPTHMEPPVGHPKPLTVPPFESMADSLLEPPASHRWPSSQPFVLNSLGDPLAQPTVSCQGEHSAADPAAIIQRCMASVKATDTTSPAVVVERSSFPLSFLPRAAWRQLEIPNRILKILAVAVRRLGARDSTPRLQKMEVGAVGRFVEKSPEK